MVGRICDYGPYMLDYGLSDLDYGPYMLDYGLSDLDHGRGIRLVRMVWS
jgi:hypothetical protein